MQEITPSPTQSAASLAPSRSFRAKFFRELKELDLPEGPTAPVIVEERDLALLPQTAQRFLRFMRVVGRPRAWSFCVRWGGHFRRHPDESWMPCEAWQYNSALSIARIFHMRLRSFGVVPLYVRDLYHHGRGRMRGRVFDTFDVVDQSDEKISTGELVTWLNDAVLFAPSMLLGPATSWQSVDDDGFDVAVTDGGRTVTARVFVDERGAPTDFSTTDRYGDDPAGPKMVKTRWSTPVTGWNLDGDIPCITGGKAVWHFASGDLCYAEFAFDGRERWIDLSPTTPPR